MYVRIIRNKNNTSTTFIVFIAKSYLSIVMNIGNNTSELISNTYKQYKYHVNEVYNHYCSCSLIINFA